MIALHTGNAYQEKDGTLVLETQTYENKDKNPFAIVMMDKINDINKVVEQNIGSKFKKISLNLKDGTIQMENYMAFENGALDLPMFNPKYSGVKNCFTYLTLYFGKKVVDENFSQPIYKYDSCKGKIVATYDAESTLA